MNLDCQYLMPVVGGEVVPWICSVNGLDCPFYVTNTNRRYCDRWREQQYDDTIEQVSLEELAEMERQQDDEDISG